MIEIQTKLIPIIDVESGIIPDNTAGVTYILNGGKMIDGSEDLYFTIIYPKQIYPRVNTDIGTKKIEREGYILTGWNTEANGNGSHIGLGSRCNIIIIVMVN